MSTPICYQYADIGARLSRFERRSGAPTRIDLDWFQSPDAAEFRERLSHFELDGQILTAVLAIDLTEGWAEIYNDEKLRRGYDAKDCIVRKYGRVEIITKDDPRALPAHAR
jgi:hypothetical protein